MTICDSCYGKNKTIKESWRTVKFELVVTPASSSNDDNDSCEFNLCHACYKALDGFGNILFYALKRHGAVEVVEKIRTIAANN